MKCQKCRFQNPEGAKFCVECGSKFEMPCPACGFANSPNFKFCAECGEKLTNPPASKKKALSFEEKPWRRFSLKTVKNGLRGIRVAPLGQFYSW